MPQPKPKLPTYRTAAAVLEGHTGSGMRLAGWTVLRTLLIAPPMLLVGVPSRQAWIGAMVSSVLISGLTLLRIFDGRNTNLAGVKRRQLAGARSHKHGPRRYAR